MTDKMLERFWDKVEVDSKTGCWNWVGSLDTLGYGLCWNGKRVTMSHRFAYEVNKSKINPELELDHLCKNKKCVNPEHLEEVSHKDNILRSKPRSTQTHCKRGHPLFGDNLYRRPDNGRDCKTCMSVRNEKYKERRLK